MTTPDSTPGGLREILDAYRDFWIAPKAGRILNTDQAIAAIEALVPEKRPIQQFDTEEPREFMTGQREILVNKNHQAIGYNSAINQIHHNFKGDV